jgi:hypothetical protein
LEHDSLSANTCRWIDVSVLSPLLLSVAALGVFDQLFEATLSAVGIP